jgi:putative FmdB family regulatory protein
MPVYEYECGACSHRFEEWQKISDKPVKTCPKCGKHKVERLISQTSFHLKGGGWYSDLYSSSKGGSPSGDKGSGGGGDSGGGGSEAKGSSGTKTAEAPKAAETKKPDSKKKDGGKKTAAAS